MIRYSVVYAIRTQRRLITNYTRVTTKASSGDGIINNRLPQTQSRHASDSSGRNLPAWEAADPSKHRDRASLDFQGTRRLIPIARVTLPLHGVWLKS